MPASSSTVVDGSTAGSVSSPSLDTSTTTASGVKGETQGAGNRLQSLGRLTYRPAKCLMCDGQPENCKLWSAMPDDQRAMIICMGATRED